MGRLARKHQAATPPAVGPWFRRNLVSCGGVGSGQIQTGLPDPNPKPTSAWLGRSMRRSRAYSFWRKNLLFCAFFHVQPKHPNGAVFVNIEGLRLWWNKLGYGPSQRALMVRPMQKERLKSPQKIANSRKPGLLGHFGHFGQNGNSGHILASNFRARVATPKKVPHGVFLR